MIKGSYDYFKFFIETYYLLINLLRNFLIL